MNSIERLEKANELVGKMKPGRYMVGNIHVGNVHSFQHECTVFEDSKEPGWLKYQLDGIHIPEDVRDGLIRGLFFKPIKDIWWKDGKYWYQWTAPLTSDLPWELVLDFEREIERRMSILTPDVIQSQLERMRNQDYFLTKRNGKKKRIRRYYAGY